MVLELGSNRRHSSVGVTDSPLSLGNLEFLGLKVHEWELARPSCLSGNPVALATGL